VSKVFSQDHYEQDDWAKFQIVEWLNNKGYKAFVNPDKFGIDILALRWGRQFAFEVEVKHNWRGEHFPYGQIHFSARKLKFVETNVETWFVMLNHERTHALLVSGKDFMAAPIVEKRTKYTENEKFVEVDAHWAIFRNLKEEA
jgi:hypothetical protein